jgi:hypothetical protein
MKSLRTLLFITVLSLSAMAFAQADAHKHAAAQSDAPKSDAQKSFDQLKTLAGTWHATVTTDPPVKEMGNGAMGDVTLRVTSRGNALVHEMGETGKDDPTKYDHPITMFYLDNDRWQPGRHRTVRPWNLIFLTWPATRNTATCNMQFSLLSTRTITLKTGRFS